MKIATSCRRPLGTMVTYGYPRITIENELNLARTIRASVLEILPDWRTFPDPVSLRDRLRDSSFVPWSVHGSWGGQSVKAERVDLANQVESARRESVDDLRACVDWAAELGAQALVVHPGGLSDPEAFIERRHALSESLVLLASHARGTGVTVCVENMPPGVYPGSRMADLYELVSEIRLPELALALDTGHAHLSGDLLRETRDAGSLLFTTHVHDNEGRQDSHEIPGDGRIDWPNWAEALDDSEYGGPIILECIRKIRERPERINEALRSILERLTSKVTD